MAGMSLSDYLLGEVREIAKRPTLAEFRERCTSANRFPSLSTSADSCARNVLRDDRVDVSATVDGYANPSRTTHRGAYLRAQGYPAHRSFARCGGCQVLRRLVREGTLARKRAEEAMEDLIAVRVTRYAPVALLHRIWRLRQNLSAYDAAYVALAEELEAPLITREQRIAAAPVHPAATIEVF